MSEFLSALEQEFALISSPGPVTEIETLYLGGGTPSRLGGEGIRDLLLLVKRYFVLTEVAEITIEANPDDVTPGAAEAWRACGVNRVSLGVQSFDERVLEWMHRTHDAEQAIHAVSILREAGIENISLDLIFALPESLERSWESDLTRALSLSPDHISLYGLTIEPRTPLARWQQNGSVLPAEEDCYAADFLLAHQMTAAAGYSHYEVSNFAKPGRESRHNSAYWTGAAYLGTGPSAHSFDGETRRWNVAPYSKWLDLVSAGKSAIEGAERLTGENRLAERVYLGLRTNSGLTASRSDRDVAKRWSDEGWAKIEGEIVRLTPEGWLRLDALAAGLTGL